MIVPTALRPLPSPRAAAAVQDVPDLAAEHDRLDPVKARMYRFEVREITTGRQRWLALLAHRTNPALIRLLDALVADQPGRQTLHGFFTPEAIAENGGRATTAPDGRRCLAWPILSPWAVPPDAKGQGGERGEPVYRAIPEPEAAPEAPERDWWEAAPSDQPDPWQEERP